MSRRSLLTAALSAMLAACATAPPPVPAPDCPPPPVTQITPPPATPAATGMTLARMDEIVRDTGTEVRSDGRTWELTIRAVRLGIITDARHDRMRIISPVGREADLTGAQRSAMMEANFHTALDARYAISNGTVFAAFIHPLEPLGDDELRAAIRQVASLVETFGTTYSSGELLFGAPAR